MDRFKNGLSDPKKVLISIYTLKTFLKYISIPYIQTMMSHICDAKFHISPNKKFILLDLIFQHKLITLLLPSYFKNIYIKMN